MAADWKSKYLSALAQEEKREEKFQKMIGLLVRAAVRMSMVAEGVDKQLDQQLSGLRQILRETPSSRDLTTLVSALDGQVKRLEDVKSERAKTLATTFTAISKQLKTLKPEKSTVAQLKKFEKSLKARSGKIYEYPPLIKELAKLQQAAFETMDKPESKGAFWSQWFSGSDERDEQQVVENKTSSDSAIEEPSEEDAPREEDVLDLSSDVGEIREVLDSDIGGKEPPFSKYSQFIKEVLTELLDQIDPPPKLAVENYKAARKQLSRELPWYELVPTLEDVSLVVISAFDQNQKEFEQYLKQLNNRLSKAYEFISASQVSNEEGAAAAQRLRDSMTEQVSAIQQSVNEATEIDHLKSQVNNRLDEIISAMDNFQAEESERENSLSEQLDSLVERVKLMETESQDAEKRIEEQRQKALRDVLTQLPNREAYQQRVAQEFDRWQRYGRPLSMAVCDIDHFKRINDNYGHLAGDKVLRIVAKSLVKRLRKTDFIARYGGEEFVILLPETDQEQSLKVVEGVREAIANCPFHFKDTPVTITMSFGVTGFIEGDKLDGVFERADKALYQAKGGGRNNSVLAPTK